MANYVRDTGKNLSRYRNPRIPIRVTFRRFSAGQSLKAGSSRSEQVVTLLSGELRLTEPAAVLKRRSVFQDPPAAAYVGCGQQVIMNARMSGEAIVVECEATRPGPVAVLRGAKRVKRGKPGYQRIVYNVLPEDFPAERLLVGETFNNPGNWSSFPPHKHDRRSKDERRLQEVYFFKVLPTAGFGFMHLYDKAGLDETFTIRNNDLVWIPRGYHPVSAMPGHRLYYLWALAGEGRTLKWHTDEKFRWLL